ncbi:diaminopimelate decarboxylase family protein [Streptomyces sp. NPDC096339]|uniref:diaminopimelate decarboxylase family protein n=1 Tax=Streptomyces sp. NPDC096339 TaxID=3366086 RepID=UPI003823F152
MTTSVIPRPDSGTGDLSVWPASTARLAHGGLAVGGVALADVAARFGTPVYVLDEGEVRERCRAYRGAFPEAEVLYAAKAFLSRAMVRWVQEEGLGLDVCSAGELELAVTAGFPPERIVLHGNAKSPHDLDSALRLGVGRIVIDSPSEIARIAAAVGPELDMGGGHGVAYRPGEPALDVGALARKLRSGLEESCAAAGMAVPRLVIEPGRGVVGPAGVALYRVLAVKRTGDTLFVAVDGGMSDNPRPALYGVRYAPRLIGRTSAADSRTATVVGRHCEAGDVLAAGVELPGDIRPGDLIAVPVAGAYQLSMASGYNMVGRPPVAAVNEGTVRLLVRRETLADLRRRDIGA